MPLQYKKPAKRTETLYPRNNSCSVCRAQKPPHLQKLMVGKVNNKYSHPIIKKKETTLNISQCFTLLYSSINKTFGVTFLI
jgi:hypothetical protein